jgi:hypothetical protein
MGEKPKPSELLPGTLELLILKTLLRDPTSRDAEAQKGDDNRSLSSLCSSKDESSMHGHGIIGSHTVLKPA